MATKKMKETVADALKMLPKLAEAVEAPMTMDTRAVELKTRD